MLEYYLIGPVRFADPVDADLNRSYSKSSNMHQAHDCTPVNPVWLEKGFLSEGEKPREDV